MSSFKKTLVIAVDPGRPDKKTIALAAGVIRKGGLVAFPTETVYGIAASLKSRKAMSRLSRVKNRPGGKHYTVHIAGVNIIRKMGCRISRHAKALMDRYWPGPLTLVLESRYGGTVGFRMPANPVALRLISAAKVPVVAPSANTSGLRPPVKASQVLKQLGGKIDIVLDAGPTEVGVESTVVDMSVEPFKILREGAIRASMIKKALSNG